MRLNSHLGFGSILLMEGGLIELERMLYLLLFRAKK